MRAALYWVPAEHDPLFAAGSAWLGRDLRLGLAVAQPPIAGIAEVTCDARRYGLHATLRPPMRLATALEDFRAAAHLVAREYTPFALPALRVCDVGGFLALRESEACTNLRDLADRCVLATEAHRAPADDAELARRRAAGLSARQDTLLTAYGYPYVLDQWFFHVTLTRRLGGAEMAAWRPLAEAHFAAALGAPRRVEAVCVCVQDGGDFTVAEEIRLGKERLGEMSHPPQTPRHHLNEAP
jgi:hypothetical protein